MTTANHLRVDERDLPNYGHGWWHSTDVPGSHPVCGDVQIGTFGRQRVGTCSLCGGGVYGFRGVWFGVDSPGPDRCTQCQAVRADDVIEMRKPGPA